jgi:hypothetical protein
MTMASFRPPYRKDLRIGPAQYLGYRHLAAYLADCGATAKAIQEACAQARDENAPKDAVSRNDYGRWYTRRDMTNLVVGRRLDSYAAALLKYEEDLKKERDALR